MPARDVLGHPHVTLAAAVFQAWSSGDPDAPAPYWHPDGVLYDVVGGRHEGWPEIRRFFARGLKAWTDLVLAPEDYWVNEDGVAVRWVMSATVPDDRFGAEHAGKKYRVDGMSELRIADGRLTYEADHWSADQILRSLEGAS